MKTLSIFKLGSSESKESAQADSEDVVQKSIGCGRWHLWVYLAIFLVKIPVAWHQLAIIFIAPPVPYRCQLNDTEACSADCPEIVFDQSIFERTTVSQWSLVCGRAWMADLIQTFVMVGILVGNVLFGFLADRFGRRKPLIIAVIVQVVSGALAAYAPWFVLFVFLKFLSALATGGTMVTSFVMVMEFVGSRYRTSLGLFYQIPFNIGHLTLVGAAYLLRDWRHLQLAISLPAIILISYQIILPESPRWLLAVGKEDECIKVMEKIARHNGLPTESIRGDVQRQLSEKPVAAAEQKGGNFLDLVRTRTMAVRTACISFNWAVCGLSFFGVAQYMGQLPGDIFLNVAISAVVGMPGIIILLYTLQAWGRRATLIMSNVITGVSCLLIPTVPTTPEWTWASTTLGCLGMFGMSLAFPTVYLYSGEMYPTRVRNLGVGFSSMVCRVGSMLAPFVTRLRVLRPALPPLVFGLLPLAAAALCAFLPETRGCRLPDTVQEAEQMGRAKPDEK